MPTHIETISSLGGSVFDRVPYRVHLCLCRLHAFPGAHATTLDYARRIATCIAVHMESHGGGLPDDLAEVFSDENSSIYADSTYVRAGRAETLRVLNATGSASRFLWPDRDFSWFERHKRRIARRPETHISTFRYALRREDVPAALEPLFPAGVGHRRAGIVLRYLGALAERGEDVDELTAVNLVTPERLAVCVARASSGDREDAISCLYALKAALSPLGGAAFAAALAPYGVMPPQPNTNYQVYVPEAERRLLEANLDRPPSQRQVNEPCGLTPEIRRQVEQSLGAFHKAIATDQTLAAAGPLGRDTSRALEMFEAGATHWETISLHARVKEIFMAYRRIFYEHRRQALGSPAHAYDVQEAILTERVRELRLAIEREAVVLPDHVTPRDIRRVGAALISFSWHRLEGLRTTPTPYRSLLTLAEMFRNGVIFVLFSYIVLRVGDMSNLFHGATIYRGAIWTIDIEASKNGAPITQSFPRWVSRILTHYDDIIRPMIAPVTPLNENAFWMSRSGSALTITAFQDIVPRYTVALLHTRIYAQLLRKIEATAALMADPENPESASIALRHRQPTTTRVFYQTRKAVQQASAHVGCLHLNDAALFDLPESARPVEARPRNAPQFKSRLLLRRP